MRLIACALVGTLGAGCSGIQIGDSGDDDTGCDFREQSVPTLDTLPEGYSRTPEELLGPTTRGVDGKLTLESGDVYDVSFWFEPGPGPYIAEERVETAGIEDCAAEGVVVMGTMHVEGNALSGAAEDTEVRVLGEQVWTGLGNVEWLIDVEPQFDEPPEGEVTLVLPVQRDLDGKWRGQWRFISRMSCQGKELCSGFQEAPLGEFRAP